MDQLMKRLDRIALVALAGYITGCAAIVACKKQQDKLEGQQFQIDCLMGQMRELVAVRARDVRAAAALERATGADKPPVKPRAPRGAPKMTVVK
jgi:hypothetical protein